MKMNYALVCGLFLSASLIAQTNPVSPAAAPARPLAPAAQVAPAPGPLTPAAPTVGKPVVKPAPKKPAVKRPAVVEKPVALLAGPAVVDARNVNVRGRSTILSEVLARLTKGDPVTVIEQVENKWAKGDDMKQWARIAYPTNAAVWVFASFVDASRTVTVPKLNLRGGPGENYSVVGRLPKGTTVTEITTQGEWMRIEPPANATAFIAAMYLKQDAAMLAAAAEPALPPVALEPASTNVVTDVAAVIVPVVETDAAPATPATNAASSDLEKFVDHVAMGTNAVPEVEEPLPPRIVMREGIVHGATSIQAPSFYGLAGMDTGRTINYLYTSSTNVSLGRYIGRHIIATGEESLDDRWPNTPVLNLQRIQLVEE